MGEPRRVAADFLEAFNAPDEERIRARNAENGGLEAPGEVRLEGREAATEYAMGWLRAFPDARITVRTEVAADDWVVQEFTFDGTHEEPLSTPTGEIPSTGRHLTG